MSWQYNKTNKRTDIDIHEQTTEHCVFERRLIVCIKDGRKKESEEEKDKTKRRTKIHVQRESAST